MSVLFRNICCTMTALQRFIILVEEFACTLAFFSSKSILLYAFLGRQIKLSCVNFTCHLYLAFLCTLYIYYLIIKSVCENNSNSL